MSSGDNLLAKKETDDKAPSPHAALEKMRDEASSGLKTENRVTAIASPNESEGSFAVKGFTELLRGANAIAAAGIECMGRTCNFVGEQARLFGFDANSGNALLAQMEFAARSGELRKFSEASGSAQDTEGRKYKELKLGSQSLFQDLNGSIFFKTEIDGKQALQELPGLRSVSQDDHRLSVEKPKASDPSAEMAGKLSSKSEIRAAGPSENPAASLEHLAEASEQKQSELPSLKAIAQSNDYAKQHLLQDKIQDGFRTAGQYREFTPDGRFSASDRAATIVDRANDPKLRQIIDDAKTQFADLPPRERARALADYVNKIMGPSDGNEQALDDRYRKRMQESAGKSLLLSDFVGEGACTQRALLLKVLADEMGLNSSIVRGNGGSHVWNTFEFDKGKSEIFDTRAKIYAVESSDMHHPSKPGSESINGRDFLPGQQVVAEGKQWRVEGYDSKDGKIQLSRDEQHSTREAEWYQQNPGRELSTGQTYTLLSESGEKESWTFQGRKPDGSLSFTRSETLLLRGKDLARSVMELDGTSNPDTQYLQNNWKKLVQENPRLSDKQKSELQDSMKLVSGSENQKLSSDFRKMLEEIGRLGKSSAADAQARSTALSKIANTMVNYPEAVRLPVDRVIGAESMVALNQVAESFAQSAPHESKAPTEIDGKPTNRGEGYEHYASQALQDALKDQSALNKLIDAGKIPAGDWVFVPAAKGSVADDLKIDGMLVDMKSGKAVFIDFAMQGGDGSYRALQNKIVPYTDGQKSNTYKSTGNIKHPWALTLDNDTIGWNQRTGLSNGTIDSMKILDRLGSYLKGTQGRDLKIVGARQAMPAMYDIQEIRTALGNRFPSFEPVRGQLEADLLTRDREQTVQTRQAELNTIERTLKSKVNPDLQLLGMAANTARTAAEQTVGGSDVFSNGLRAAVEADKLGVRESTYVPGEKAPQFKFSTGADYASAPAKYLGKPFIGLSADAPAYPSTNQAAQIRIYQNGDVLVGTASGEFQAIGNIGDLVGSIGQGLDPAVRNDTATKSQLAALSKLARNYDAIKGDIEKVSAKKMSPEKFWEAHPEMKLLTDGIQHGQANKRAAQEARPILEQKQLIEKNPELAKLADSEKTEIARKSLQLAKEKLSFQDIGKIIELEKTGLSTPDSIKTLHFQKDVGKEADKWTAVELKSKFETALDAQAKDYPHITELSTVHKLNAIQSELSVDSRTSEIIYQLQGALPNATNAELLVAKQMGDNFKDAGLAVSVDNIAAIFNKHGNMSAAAIEEMGRINSRLKKDFSPLQIADIAVKNVQVELLYGSDKAAANAIRAKAIELIKERVPIEQAHDTAALMLTKNLPQSEALELARTMEALRQQQTPGSLSELSNTAAVLQATAKLGSDSTRAELQSLIAEGINQHGNGMGKLKNFLEQELYNRGTDEKLPNVKDWEKLFDQVSNCKSNEDLAKLLGLPSHAEERKLALESYQKLFKENEAKAPNEASLASIQSQLAGNPTFVRLSDEARMNEALKQFTDRALQRMPESNSERADFLSKQLKAAMRKQLNVLTDANLPEALRDLQIKVVDGDAKAPAVVQGKIGEPATIEIPAKLLNRDPRGAIVDVYTQASGLSILELLQIKGNRTVTMQSLQPMLEKIAGQAETIVGARSLALANQEKPQITSETAASDRKIKLDPRKPLLTSWDGENLSFGAESFHVKSEIEKLEKERESRVKDLEEQYKKARELADSSKKAEDIAKAQALETQLAAERQSLRVLSELKVAMNGERGRAAQERARNLVRTAADRAIEERLNPKEGSGAPISRASAIAMVVSSLAAMYFAGSAPAQAETYSGSFRN